MEDVVHFFLALLALLFTTSNATFTTPCAQQEVLKELYRSLYDVLDKNAVCSSSDSPENIELLDIGLTLAYSDFNPGKQSRFAVPGELPTFVLENGLPLVDKVYPTGSARFREQNNKQHY